MKYFSIKTTIDPFIHKIDEYKDTRPIRVINAAIPLFLMGKTTGKPLSYALNAYQIGLNFYQLSEDRIQKNALKFTHTCTQIGLATFHPKFAPLYSALIHVASDPKNKELWLSRTLTLAALYTHRPEILVASLFFQAASEFKVSYQQYRDERYIEAFGKLALGVIHGYAGIHTVQAIPEINRRNRLWQEVEPLKTGLTRKEFNAIIDYVKKAPPVDTPTHFTDHTLPRPITLTPEGYMFTGVALP